MILKADNYQLHFRVYDDGLAYRFHTDFPDSLNVLSEEVTYCFPKTITLYFRKSVLCYLHNNRYSNQ